MENEGKEAKRFLTALQAARRAGLPVTYVERRAKERTIPVLKAGGRTLIDYDAMVAVLSAEAREGMRK